jgi:hypothetical protein
MGSRLLLVGALVDGVMDIECSDEDERVESGRVLLRREHHLMPGIQHGIGFCVSVGFGFRLGSWFGSGFFGADDPDLVIRLLAFFNLLVLPIYHLENKRHSIACGGGATGSEPISLLCTHIASTALDFSRIRRHSSELR